MGSAATAIHLGRLLPGVSCDQPGRLIWKRDWRMLAAAPPLFGLAPGGVCRAGPVTRTAVRSYRTLSPLPRKARRFAFCGTVPGVAPPEVIRHRASKEPGLSSLSADTLADRAAVRPADTGNKGLLRSTVKSEAALHLRLHCLSRISRMAAGSSRIGSVVGEANPSPRRRRTKSALLGYSRGWARDLGIAATVAFLASPAAGYITEPRSRWMAASTLNRRCRRRSRGEPHRLRLDFFVNW